MINVNYQMDNILCQIFKIFLVYLKKRDGSTDNPSTRIYTNKLVNRITFKIKAGYYL